MSRWFRHYAGMMRDDKLVSVAIKSKQPVERVVWVWGAILESAAEIDNDGVFRLDCAEVAYFLRTDEADIRAILGALADADRVAADRVVHWGDRQFKSDRSAERQAAYRGRKRGQVSGTDDQSPSPDDMVTSLSRHGDAPETETETETETDTPSLRSGERAPRATRIPDDFEPDLAWAEEQGLSPQQARAEAAKFIDHWRAKSGADATKRDWPATWRNWVRRALERSPQQPRSPPPGKPLTLVGKLHQMRQAAENDRYSEPFDSPVLNLPAPHAGGRG